MFFLNLQNIHADKLAKIENLILGILQIFESTKLRNIIKHLRHTIAQNLQLDLNINNDNKLENIRKILNPKLELLPNVCDFIKQSLAL